MFFSYLSGNEINEPVEWLSADRIRALNNSINTLVNEGHRRKGIEVNLKAL
jgi:hypothetical protein